MLNASCLDKLDTKGSVDLYKKAIEDPFVIVALDSYLFHRILSI